jgi:hypothetical protein
VTDEEIRKAIEGSFQTQFMNYGGDSLMEGPCNNNEELYDRAEELLDKMQLTVSWIDNEGEAL